MDWPSEQAEDITETRFFLVLAEQVYAVWLRSYTPQVAAGPQKDLAALVHGRKRSFHGAA